MKKYFLESKLTNTWYLCYTKLSQGNYQPTFYFMLEENCGFKDRVVVISVCCKEHSRYHGDDGDSNHYLLSQYYVSGNMLVHQVGGNFLVLQIRTLKLKKTKLLKVIKLVSSSVITSVLENSDVLFLFRI